MEVWLYDDEVEVEFYDDEMEVYFYDDEIEIYLDNLKWDGQAMSMRRGVFKIKEDDFGMIRYFRLRNYNRSTAAGYAVKMYVWKSSNLLVDGVSCTAVYSDGDTLIGFTPTSTMFPTPGDYDGELEFTKLGYQESVWTFEVEVIPSNPA